MKSYRKPQAVLLCLALGACTSVTAENALVDPGKYANYSCADLQRSIVIDKRREARLTNLMAQADGTPGGDFVNFLAYRGEYMEARANLRVASETLRDKRCPPAPR